MMLTVDPRDSVFPERRSPRAWILVVLLGTVLLGALLARIRSSTEGHRTQAVVTAVAESGRQGDDGMGSSLDRKGLEQAHDPSDPKRVAVAGVRPGTVLHGMAIDQNGAPVRLSELWLVNPRTSSKGRPNEMYLDYGDRGRVVATIRTDETGSFRSQCIGPGEYWMGPAPVAALEEGRQPPDLCTHAQKVFVSSDLDDLELTLHVYRGIYIRGNVFTPKGDTASSAVVIATIPSGIELLSVGVDEHGSFAAGPLAPGEYSLQAHSPGVFLASDRVAANAGDQDVVLQLVQGASIEGFVVDETTRRPNSAEVTLYSRESDDSTPLAGTRDGHFLGEGIQPGVYDIRAESLEGKVGLIRGYRLAAGAEVRPVTIGLSTGAILVLDRIGNAEPATCEMYLDDAKVGESYLPDRESARVIVPEGPIEIRFQVGGQDRKVDVQTVAGREHHVRLPH